MATEDVSRLPKWAQSRIQVLEANIKHLEARQASVLGGESVTRESVHETADCVIVEPYSNAPVKLHGKTHVEFRTASGQEYRVCVTERGTLDISSSPSSLHVQPRAYNSIELSASR